MCTLLDSIPFMECTVDTRQDSDSTCVLGAYTRCGWLFFGITTVCLFVDIGPAGGSTLATIVAGVQVARKVRERRRRRCRTSSMVGGASKCWRWWFVATDHERYRKHRDRFCDEFFIYNKSLQRSQLKPTVILRLFFKPCGLFSNN